MSLMTPATPSSRWKALALAAAIIAADQASKIAVVDHLMGEAPRVYEVTPFFNLVMAWNYGISFGTFGNGAVSPWMFFAFSLALAVGLGAWLWRAPVAYLRYGLAGMIGGAIGNALDRMHWGAVADFLDFHLGSVHFWAFNVADAAISLGAVVLVFDSFFRREEK